MSSRTPAPVRQRLSQLSGVQEAFAAMLESSGRSQKDIAEEAGFERPNVISMMKAGHMKVPIDRAPALARACGADPAAFTQLVMARYCPGLLETLGAELGASFTRPRTHVDAGLAPERSAAVR